MDKLTTNFQNNGYPVSLIKNKIENIKKQNFTPVTKKIDWKKKLKTIQVVISHSIQISRHLVVKKLKKNSENLLKVKHRNLIFRLLGKTLKFRDYSLPKQNLLSLNYW